MRFKPTEIATIIVASIAFLGALVSAFYTYTSRNRELDIELIKIGIGILRADPKETQTNAAREWAIRLIEIHSGQRFSDEARNELLNKQLGYDRSVWGSGFDSVWGSSGGNVPWGGEPKGKPAPVPQSN